MSYQEKRTIAMISAGTASLAAYVIYFALKFGTTEDLRFWAVSMLIFIGAGIGLVIIAQIIFHIVLSIGIAAGEKTKDGKVIEKAINEQMIEDEMDKKIALKASKVSLGASGFGFMAALLSLVFYASPVVMLNIIFLSCQIGMILEGVVTLFYYKKGVRNG